MAFKSEYAAICEEIAAKAERAKPKLPATERAAWLWRRKPEPEPDHFAWHSIEDLIGGKS